MRGPGPDALAGYLALHDIRCHVHNLPTNWTNIGDTLLEIAAHAEERDLPFPVVKDVDQRLADELGIEDAFDTGVCLIEWPVRLGPLLPDTRLLVALAMAGGDRRRATLDAGGDWPARLDGMVLGDG